jgi:hypothetical protein
MSEAIEISILSIRARMDGRVQQYGFRLLGITKKACLYEIRSAGVRFYLVVDRSDLSSLNVECIKSEVHEKSIFLSFDLLKSAAKYNEMNYGEYEM